MKEDFDGRKYLDNMSEAHSLVGLYFNNIHPLEDIFKFHDMLKLQVLDIPLTALDMLKEK